MLKYDLETLKVASRNLMFTMPDAEYALLLKDFAMMVEQMKLIDQIPGLDQALPMDFPYMLETDILREDIAVEPLQSHEVLANAKDTYAQQIRVPKVVK